MKICKVVKKIEFVDIEFCEITLLSIEEAKKVPQKLRAIGDSWWLRSPGILDDFSGSVLGDGLVYHSGISVYDNELGVRPALKIYNLESLNLKVGNEIIVGGEMWTVVDEDLALCNRNIKYMKFAKKSECNDYEKSDIKVFLDKWAKDTGLVFKNGFSGCEDCIHDNDSKQLCRLRQCVHAVSPRECFEMVTK